MKVIFLCALALLLLNGKASAVDQIVSAKLIPGSNTLSDTSDVANGVVQIELSTGGKSYEAIICESNVLKPDANKFCSFLGYKEGARVVSNVDFTKLKMPSASVENVACAGAEIRTCSFKPMLTRPSCQKPSDTFAVICQKKVAVSTTAPPTLPTLAPVNCSIGASANVRLLDDTNNTVTTSGRLEMRTSSTSPWKPVCSFNFQAKEAELICGMLCTSGTIPRAIAGPNKHSGILPEVQLSCPATAKSISDCTRKDTTDRKQCGASNLAYVSCTDPKTTVSPDPVADVTCDENLATVALEKSKNPGITNDSILLANSGAKESSCSFASTDNGTHIVIVFTFNFCGGTMAVTSSATIFKNTLLRVFPLVGGVVTQTNITFGVHCSLTKKGQADGDNMKSKPRTAPPITGTDSPTVVMELFTDKAMKNKLARGAEITVGAGQLLYLRLKDTTNVGKTRLVTRDCWITPDENRSSATKRDLLKNACLDTKYAVSLSDVDAKTQVLEFKPILFPGFKTIYLHCNTNTCLMTDTSDTCKRRCESSARRRKRSVEENPKTTNRVDGGPFYIFDLPSRTSRASASEFLLLLLLPLLLLLSD